VRFVSILAGLLLVPLPGICFAETEKSTAPVLGASPLSGGVLLETVGGLLLILLLIFGLSWLVRRFGRLPMAAKADLNILGGVSLGPRERAVLLQVGGAKLLVGVAPGRVQTLYVLGEGDMAKQESTHFSGQLETELAEHQK
jgi:flagellar protein FliO/FliZ